MIKWKGLGYKLVLCQRMLSVQPCQLRFTNARGGYSQRCIASGPL